jgi:hypothetical protein
LRPQTKANGSKRSFSFHFPNSERNLSCLLCDSA